MRQVRYLRTGATASLSTMAPLTALFGRRPNGIPGMWPMSKNQHCLEHSQKLTPERVTSQAQPGLLTKNPRLPQACPSAAATSTSAVSDPATSTSLVYDPLSSQRPRFRMTVKWRPRPSGMAKPPGLACSDRQQHDRQGGEMEHHPRASGNLVSICPVQTPSPRHQRKRRHP